MNRWSGWILLLLVMSANASAQPAEHVFHEWLTAYNANDASALRAFNERRLGDPDAAFFLDSREETEGLDLVKIERNDPVVFVAMLRERSFPSFQRVTVKLESAGSTQLEKLKLTPQPLPQPKALASLDAFASRLAARDRFSGVVVVQQYGKRIYEKAFGLANRSTKAPVRLDTPFFIASQGKMFTGVAILQLVESGKISLDDTVGKHLVDYPNQDVATRVTIRHLLTHRAGAGDIGILEPEDGANRAWVRTITDIIKLNGKRPPEFEPGTREEYSNYGFILLGAVIESVTGQSYYDYVNQHVFRPAGMTATGFPTKDELEGVAIGYTTDANGQLISNIPQLPWRGASAGGGVSTADDELRFVNALRAGKLISPAMLAEATRRQIPWYGYGFISSGPDNFPHWGHGGGAPGMSLALGFYPTNEMSMVCMSNRDPIVCDRLLFNLHFHLAPKKSLEIN